MPRPHARFDKVGARKHESDNSDIGSVHSSNGDRDDTPDERDDEQRGAQHDDLATVRGTATRTRRDLTSWSSPERAFQRDARPRLEASVPKPVASFGGFSYRDKAQELNRTPVVHDVFVSPRAGALCLSPLDIGYYFFMNTLCVLALLVSVLRPGGHAEPAGVARFGFVNFTKAHAQLRAMIQRGRVQEAHRMIATSAEADIFPYTIEEAVAVYDALLAVLRMCVEASCGKMCDEGHNRFALAVVLDMLHTRWCSRVNNKLAELEARTVTEKVAYVLENHGKTLPTALAALSPAAFRCACFVSDIKFEFTTPSTKLGKLVAQCAKWPAEWKGDQCLLLEELDMPGLIKSTQGHAFAIITIKVWCARFLKSNYAARLDLSPVMNEHKMAMELCKDGDLVYAVGCWADHESDTVPGEYERIVYLLAKNGVAVFTKDTKHVASPHSASGNTTSSTTASPHSLVASGVELEPNSISL